MLTVVHVVSGAIWAGAEAMVASLATAQSLMPDVRVFVVTLNEGELASRLKARHIDLITLPETQLHAPQICGRLAEVLRRVRPDVVHSHCIKEDIVASVANALAGRAVAIRTVHGRDEAIGVRSVLRGYALRAVHRFCVTRLMDESVAVSEELASVLKSHAGFRQVSYIANGIDVASLQGGVRDDAVCASHSGVLRLGMLCRLVDIKRVDLFLLTASLLRRDFQSGMSFHIYGNGPKEAELKALASTLGVADVVRFEGFADDVPSTLKSLDAMFITSDSEGLPMVALEAMALGTPVIAHDVGQLGDLLGHGSCGTLVMNQDAQEYAAAARALAHDPQIFQQRALRARERVLRDFTSQACASRYMEKYKQLLQGKVRR